MNSRDKEEEQHKPCMHNAEIIDYILTGKKGAVAWTI